MPTDPPPTDDLQSRLSPEQRALRDMWLAEMWPVCHGADYQRVKPRRTAA